MYEAFCAFKSLNPSAMSLKTVTDFLMNQKKGYTYSTIKTAVIALSRSEPLVDRQKISDHQGA